MTNSFEVKKNWNTPQYELCEKQKTSFVGAYLAIRKQKKFQPKLDETLTDASALCCQEKQMGYKSIC